MTLDSHTTVVALRMVSESDEAPQMPSISPLLVVAVFGWVTVDILLYLYSLIPRIYAR